MSEATPEVEGGPPPLAAHPGDALPAGARLAEFEIRSVLGAGGFGIVYRAWDHALEREVALKEYMPVSLAGRAPDGRVTVRATSQSETFSLGLRSFVNEARLLARFDHPSLVRVYRFWEDNGTAYMAMPMVQGRTLRQVRQAMPPGSPGEAWCRALLDPLLGALDCMHREEVFHRDIAPDNILLTDTGHPVLLDFGAARRVIGDRSHAITAIVKPNFAPIEQYADVAAVRQGPWTDLYALAATMYYLLTGQPPLPAAARALHDELVPLARLQPADCSPEFLQAIDWAMAVRPKDRPQSLAIWRDVLEGRMAVPSRMRADVTMPNVAAVPSLSETTGRLDFDPTQPWPSGPGTGGRAGLGLQESATPGRSTASSPSVTSSAAAGRDADRPSAPDGRATQDTEPDALHDFVDTRPEAASDMAGIGSRRLRWWAVRAGGVSALLVIAVLGWRAASTPAVQPAQQAASAAAAASDASGTGEGGTGEGGVAAASSPTTAVGTVTGAGGSSSAPAPGLNSAPASASVATTQPRRPSGTSSGQAPAVPLVGPNEVLLGPAGAGTAAGTGVGDPGAGDAAAGPSSPVARPSSRPRQRDEDADRARGRERDRDRPGDSAGSRQAGVSAPSARCADKNFITRPICMKRACDSDPRLKGHPECVSMQEAEQERRDIMLHR